MYIYITSDSLNKPSSTVDPNANLTKYILTNEFN